jgi:hypothetical protein
VGTRNSNFYRSNHVRKAPELSFQLIEDAGRALVDIPAAKKVVAQLRKTAVAAGKQAVLNSHQPKPVTKSPNPPRCNSRRGISKEYATPRLRPRQ